MGGWGQGFFGPSLVYFSCQEAGLSESVGDVWGGGGFAQDTPNVITPALSTTADICLTRALCPQPTPFSSSIPHLSFPRLLLCNELPLFTS